MEINDIIQTGSKLHRLDEQQIEFLAQVITEKTRTGVTKGIPNLNLCQQKGIRHGAFKGCLETGEKRTDYFYRILETLNVIE